MSAFYSDRRGGWSAKFQLKGKQYWVKGGPFQTKEQAEAAEALVRHRAEQRRPPRVGGPVTVYRLYSGPELVYVGLTGNGHKRFGQHRRNRSWWLEVTHAEFEHFEKGGAAEVRELELIRRFQPRHNVTGRRRLPLDRRELADLAGRQTGSDLKDAA